MMGAERKQEDDRDRDRPAEDEKHEDEQPDLDGMGQEGTAEPVPGIAENQGGGIDGAIGGGQSGQGGG